MALGVVLAVLVLLELLDLVVVRHDDAKDGRVRVDVVEAGRVVQLVGEVVEELLVVVFEHVRGADAVLVVERGNLVDDLLEVGPLLGHLLLRVGRQEHAHALAHDGDDGVGRDPDRGHLVCGRAWGTGRGAGRQNTERPK